MFHKHNFLYVLIYLLSKSISNTKNSYKQHNVITTDGFHMYSQTQLVSCSVATVARVAIRQKAHQSTYSLDSRRCPFLQTVNGHAQLLKSLCIESLCVPILKYEIYQGIVTFSQKKKIILKPIIISQRPSVTISQAVINSIGCGVLKALRVSGECQANALTSS